MRLKRIFDLLVSSSALVLLAPLLIVIALTVRIDSAGPVLFRQVRVGRHGQPFTILKFRTMLHDTNAISYELASYGDARVTRLGRFLRRSKLDELPQLINVLMGDMSLVGPRPELPELVELYGSSIAKEVLSIRPGITDLASLEFYNEAELLDDKNKARIYADVILPRKLALQQRYVRERRFGLDVAIILRTLKMLIWKPQSRS